MKIFDLIKDDLPEHGGQRVLRTILDALATVENISVSCIDLGGIDGEIPQGSIDLNAEIQNRINKEETEEPPGSPTFLTCHTSPFLDTLRSIPAFQQAERSFLAKHCAIFDHRDRADDHYGVNYGDIFSNRFCGFLKKSSIPKYTLLLGPVWVHDTDFWDKDDYADTYARLLKAFGPNSAGLSPDDYVPTGRLQRTIQHRGQIHRLDFSNRVERFLRTLEIVLQTDIDGAPLCADYYEDLVLIANFISYRCDRIPEEGLEIPLAINCYKDSPPVFSCRAQKNGVGSASLVLAACENDTRSPSTADPFDDHQLLRRWSRFKNDFLAQQNAYFLERILLLRLWFHDKFNGASISTDTGEERSALFDELARRVQSMFGADGCNIYQYRTAGDFDLSNASATSSQGHLARIGGNFAYNFLKTHAQEEAAFLQRAGEVHIERSKSLCYIAVDRGEPSFFGDLTRDDLSIKKEQHPRTAFVTPLLSRGRPWGVLELLGRNPFQFKSITQRWADEIVRIITPILYDQWMLFGLKEISRIAVDTIEIDKKYELIVNHVRRLLMASSARLYLQHGRRTLEFINRCHTGLRWANDVAPSFNLEDSESISGKIISDSSNIWGYGLIDDDGFASRDDERRIRLTEEGHHCYAVMPIRDSRGNCFASLVFTGRDFGEFNPIWDPIVETISQHLSVVLEAIHLQEEEVEERNEYFAHTMKTRINRLKSGSDRLLTILEPLIGDPATLRNVVKFTNEVEGVAALARKHKQDLSRESREVLEALRITFPNQHTAKTRKAENLPNLVRDFKNHLEEVRKSAVYLAGGINAEHPADANPVTWDGVWADLRLSLLQSIKQSFSDGPHANTVMEPDRSILPEGVRFRMPEQILVETLNNIIDNAIKYDFGQPSISLQVFRATDPDVVTINVRNLAPKLSVEEAEKIKKGGFRGDYARKRDLDGTGVGLKYCADIANVWGFALDYKIPQFKVTDSENEKRKLGWHIVKLTFSGRSLRKNWY